MRWIQILCRIASSSAMVRQPPTWISMVHAHPWSQMLGDAPGESFASSGEWSDGPKVPCQGRSRNPHCRLVVADYQPHQQATALQ